MKNNNSKKNNNFKTFTFIELITAVLFSVLCLNFSIDVSLLSFPIAAVYTGITVYCVWFKMIREENGCRYFSSTKLINYLPFVLLLCFILRRAGKHGTPYVYDFITVILWLINFIFSFIVAGMLSEKKIIKLTENWEKKAILFQKPKGGYRIAYEIIDWIDALVQAVFTVLIFQIFVFQLYEIPSESMVPVFLIKDRVIVSKIDCGPKFPLTDVGLPDFRSYKRGDTIVLRNPHYSMDRKSEVKTVTAQLVNMLTFMTVNLNKDENGDVKADPLVKRICGEPGEQLVMQDGTLYVRTKQSDEFKPVELDEKYAAWNLNTINPSLKRKVQKLPLTEDEYEKMIYFEQERRNFNLNVAEYNVNEIVRKVNTLVSSADYTGTFEQPSLFEYELFTNVQNIAVQIMTKKGGVDWFNQFMTSWVNTINDNRDFYSESNYRLNVITKLTFGNLISRYIELIKAGVNSTDWQNDELLKKNFVNAEILNWYIQILLDERNMPLFPANASDGSPQYIPKNCYFMMGDNRFNSLDLRHSYDQKLSDLTSYDKMSVKYYSMIAPQYIHKKYIIGKPLYRFWPRNRLGRVR